MRHDRYRRLGTSGLMGFILVCSHLLQASEAGGSGEGQQSDLETLEKGDRIRRHKTLEEGDRSRLLNGWLDFSLCFGHLCISLT